jgi:hypothetical protein
MPSRALEYSREVYTLTLDWYKVADSKGQLLLTLNGVYITVLSSIAIASSQGLFKRGASLPLVTWLLLAGTAAATRSLSCRRLLASIRGCQMPDSSSLLFLLAAAVSAVIAF